MEKEQIYFQLLGKTLFLLVLSELVIDLTVGPNTFSIVCTSQSKFVSLVHTVYSCI